MTKASGTVLTGSRQRLFDMRHLSYFVTINGKLHIRTKRETCQTPWRFDPKSRPETILLQTKEMLGLDFKRKPNPCIVEQTL